MSLELLRQKLRQSAQRGAFATPKVQVEDDWDEAVDGGVSEEPEEAPSAHALGVLPDRDDDKPSIGRLTARKNLVETKASEASGTQAAASASSPPAAEPPSARQRLEQRLRQVQERDERERDFRREMAALRSLGRLMEAVYVRPGSSASVAERVRALQTLARTSRDLAEQLLQTIEEPSRSAYARAMAMDAVIGLVAQTWEARADEDDVDLLAQRPLALLREAAVDPQVTQAAIDLSRMTWRPVQSQDEYQEVLLMAAHRAYWRLYMLGEHIDGMSASRCREAVRKMMDFLREYDAPRGLHAMEARANWLSASMGRLASLYAAELKGRQSELPERRLSEKDFTQGLEVAFAGFEGVEHHAEKLLEQAVDKPGSVDRPGA